MRRYSRYFAKGSARIYIRLISFLGVSSFITSCSLVRRVKIKTKTKCLTFVLLLFCSWLVSVSFMAVLPVEMPWWYQPLYCHHVLFFTGVVLFCDYSKLHQFVVRKQNIRSWPECTFWLPEATKRNEKRLHRKIHSNEEIIHTNIMAFGLFTGLEWRTCKVYRRDRWHICRPL